ncbi:ABC transporter permease [Streptococcus macacae]|uniref:Bacterial ABC transporter protein EcsB domain protein n=1 Tax=Streptococcus macacae NCTC 11558 TaxID=764298 RepID=G5JXY8_9STRE|nr:ABC transporter permease [Streptococcus macacae]EHJ53067.1 bacterial ABC transporter protein EcsB domain protein [Streptococcus macacae NCTC 11558]SUN77906.1 ABC transporter permease [Streptococcus macacae NCTC 11558]
MEHIFKKRRLNFLYQSLKYMRYVFNDHFVLVLIFLLGFLMVQYSRFLKAFPANHVPIILVLLVLLLFLLFWGNIATYLEEADSQFLLVQEAKLIEIIRKAKRRAYIFWTGIQTFCLLLLAPLFLRLGLSFPYFLLLLLFLGAVKGLIMERKSRQLISSKKVFWDKAIHYEQKRQQRILKFFSLFTNVKGISASVKRRSYLDFLTNLLQKSHQKTWSNLYLRAFLRSGDYLGLTLRLLILSLLSLIFIKSPLISAGLAILFNYLLLFQLLALYKHYDYQYLTVLFPVAGQSKKSNLFQLLRCILYLLTIFEVCLSFSWFKCALLVGAMLLLNEVYLSYKIKKIIDEGT